MIVTANNNNSGMLARQSLNVTLIGRDPHMEEVRRRGLFMDCLTFQETVNVKVIFVIMLSLL